MHTRHIVTQRQQAGAGAGAGAGEDRVLRHRPERRQRAAIALNLTHKDPVMRALFSNKNFRIGLSHAINRQEIIELSFEGQGEPWQVAPRPEGPVLRREDGQAVHRVQRRARQQLPRQGGHHRSATARTSAMRDGKRVSIIVNADRRRQHRGRSSGFGSTGRTSASRCRRRRWIARCSSSASAPTTSTATIWYGDAGLYDALFFPRWWFPSEEYSFYGILWAN